jgi:hypothetical protein
MTVIYLSEEEWNILRKDKVVYVPRVFLRAGLKTGQLIKVNGKIVGTCTVFLIAKIHHKEQLPPFLNKTKYKTIEELWTNGHKHNFSYNEVLIYKLILEEPIPQKLA